MDITSASFARAAGSGIAPAVFSRPASSCDGSTDALTSVRAVAGQAGADHSRFLHNLILKLGAFPIRRRQFPCFLLPPPPRLSPSLFLFLVQLFAPDPNGGDAYIPIKLLDRVKEGLIVGWKQYVRRILGVEGEAFGDSNRTGHVASTEYRQAQSKVTQKSHIDQSYVRQA